MNIEWTEHYPDPAILKREAGAMGKAILEVLRRSIPGQDLIGTCFKGSAWKEWDGILDHVPH